MEKKWCRAVNSQAASKLGELSVNTGFIYLKSLAHCFSELKKNVCVVIERDTFFQRSIVSRVEKLFAICSAIKDCFERNIEAV